MTFGNLTANLGLRYDKQGGENQAASAAANPFRPDLLPAVNYPGQDLGFEWETISPRLGLTYAMGQDRNTLLRASYSHFADQLATGVAGQLHPLALQQYAYFYGHTDGSGSLPADIGEFSHFSGNVNPITGGFLQSNAVDPGLDAPLTQEILLGVEHALRPEFVIGLQGVLRQTTDLLEFERLVFDGDAYAAANLGHVGRVHRPDDYELVEAGNRTVAGGTVPRLLPDGTPYIRQHWELRDGVSTRGGSLLKNGDREWEYTGLSATFNKRLANRWMMRGNFTVSDWTWNSPDSENQDPTRALPNAAPPTQAIDDGEEVIQSSGVGSGAKGNVYLQSDWSYAVNALYQVAPERPWGFNLAANFTGRQGYPQIYFERIFRATIPDGPFGINVPVTGSLTDERLDDVHMVDLRAEKQFSFNDFDLTVGADLFNALNESYVLQRNGRLVRANSDHVLEIVSPRILRLGVKVSLR
jgi:hypothetical protein